MIFHVWKCRQSSSCVPPLHPSTGSGVELLSFPLNSLVGEAGLGWAGLGEGKVTCVVVSPGLLWEPALLVLIFITYYSAL